MKIEVGNVIVLEDGNGHEFHAEVLCNNRESSYSLALLGPWEELSRVASWSCLDCPKQLQPYLDKVPMAKKLQHRIMIWMPENVRKIVNGESW